MIKACLTYLRDLLKHKYYVGIECYWQNQWWKMIVHDWSKFLPDEWGPCAKFYRDEIRGSKQLLEKPRPHWFLRSQLKHVHRNKHHWAHWCFVDMDGEFKALLMPEEYRREMVADWKGAAKAKKGNVVDWYKRNRYIIFMHEDTRRETDIDILGEVHE